MPELNGRIIRKTGTQYLFHTGRRWAWLPKKEVEFREPGQEPEGLEKVRLFIPKWLDERLRRRGEWKRKGGIIPI